MTLKAPHRDWKIDVLPVPDARWVGSDELLTQLWLRIAYGNMQTTKIDAPKRFVVEVASMLEETVDWFEGFERGSGVAEAWLRADLVKTLKRSPDEFAVARPLHLQAAKLRNIKKDSDGNASAIPYQWLLGEPSLLAEIKDWLEVPDPDVDKLGDLPAYALAHLGNAESDEAVLQRERLGVAPMICETRGRWFVEDLRALLAYKRLLPRAVLVDHIRRLTRLHIALHLTQTYRAVADIASDPDVVCGCSDGQVCRWMRGTVVDCGEDPRSGAARLAEEEWAETESALAAYVRAHIRLRKLYEFASSPQNKRRKFDTTTARGIARIGQDAQSGPLNQWARSRVDLVIEDPDLRERSEEYHGLGLEDFELYLSLLYLDGERRWFSYHRQVLDSVFGKNERDGAMRQPLGGRRRRRLVLTPALLETLVLTAMVKFDEHGRAATRPLRVDQLVDLLAARYGFLISEPGRLATADPLATRAMVENHGMFKNRLRQAGLFVDQSDAFLAQTIRPRVRIA